MVLGNISPTHMATLMSKYGHYIELFAKHITEDDIDDFTLALTMYIRVRDSNKK